MEMMLRGDGQKLNGSSIKFVYLFSILLNELW